MSAPTLARWPVPPGTGRRSILDTPLRLALAPLASVLAGVAAAVRRPSLLVAATVLLVCLPSQVQNLSESVTVADLAAGVAVAVIAVRLLGGDRITDRRGWLPFAAVVTSLAIATVTATNVTESVRGFVRYAELFVLIPVAVAMAIRDRRDLYLVAGAVVVTTAFEGSVGIYQYLTKTGASYAGEYVRAVGTFGAEQVLALGTLIGYGLLVTLALGLALRGRPRVIMLAVAAFLTIPLGLSLSRGAWIATAFAVLVLLLVFGWRWAVGSVAVVLLLVTVLAVGGGLTLDERVTSIVSSGSTPDRSVQDRYALWQTAVDIWKDHPVTGVGLKDFAQYRDSYAAISLSAGSDVDDPTSGFRREPLLSAHNQYLMVLSEQGAIGILAFGGWLAALTVGSFRKRRRTTAGPEESTVDERFFDYAAPAIMAWTLVDFLYGDIGAGPTGVVLATLLGLVIRRMVIVPRTGAS